jgi:hypothetical protein
MPGTLRKGLYLHGSPTEEAGIRLDNNFSSIGDFMELAGGRNVANGYAGLDSAGRLTAAQLPTEWQIKFRQGTKNAIDSYPDLALGEPAWATDTNELFVGTGGSAGSAIRINDYEISTQAISATGFILTHNQRRFLFATATLLNDTTGTVRTWSGQGTTPVQAGTHHGQRLTIFVKAVATEDSNTNEVSTSLRVALTPNDEAGSGTTNVVGSYFAVTTAAIEWDGSSPSNSEINYGVIELVWDANHSGGGKWLRIEQENRAFRFCRAVGKNSHAEGGGDGTFIAQANGENAHVEGYGCVVAATAENGHAEGSHTQALEDTTHAEGSETIARGTISHVEGWHSETNTFAECAHVAGSYGIARHCNERVLGTRGPGQAVGQHQISDIVMPVNTTNATPTVTGPIATSTGMNLTLGSKMVWLMEVTAVAYNNTDSTSASFRGTVHVRRDGAGNVSIVGVSTIPQYAAEGAMSGCTVTVAVLAATGPQFTVQGLAKDILWTIAAKITQVAWTAPS